MIRRETTPDLLNSVANAPEVRRMAFIGMPYPNMELDYSSVFEDERNIILSDGIAFCAIFKWTSPRVYECHIMALPHIRGARMMGLAREMLAYMKEHGAITVWGQPSIYNKAAVCFIRRMGLKASDYGTDPFIGEVQYFVTENL